MTTRRTTLMTSLALAAVLGGGAAATTLAPADAATTPTTAATTAVTVPTAAPVLELQTPDGRFLATTPEGGAALVPADDPNPGMRQWFLDTPPGGEYDLLRTLRNVSRTDGRDVCLQSPVEESVSVDFCDPAQPAQVLRLDHLGQEHYTLHFGTGFAAVDAEGNLTTTTDPAGALLLQATYPVG